jgi:outer membrane receptor protein involved in Fe transport
MRKTSLLSFLLVLIFSGISIAQSQQSYTVSGVAFEGSREAFLQRMQQGRMNQAAARDSSARPLLMAGANIVLFAASDTTTQFRGVNSGADGRFELTRIPNGEYILRATFVGYQTFRTTVTVNGADVQRVMVFMQEDPLTLDELRISGLRPEVEVRGDTTVYNADGIRVNPDATAEDLVRRLPGITVEDGQVQAQGQQVRRVLLDGQEFFGDDALLTLRNLPAEIVGQIEMFDQQSDQARFTGFRDGDDSRVLNIRTRPGMNIGNFGRGNLAAGTDSKYMGSGNFNYFNGPRRFSLVGMTNNINQQNFSGEDLSGIQQASGGGGRGGMMMGGAGGMWGGGGATRNFMVGQQSGTNTIHSFGLNYIDRTDKTNISSSYFFNATNNSNIQNTEREYLTEIQSDQRYNENSNANSENFNHRFNARIEHTINNRTSFIFTPRIDARATDRSSFDQSRTIDGFNELINTSTGSNISDALSYSINSNFLLRRRFEKRGRTLSANFGTNINTNKEDRLINNISRFYADEIISRLTDQNTDIKTDGYDLEVDIQYTEPLGERSQLQLEYNPSYTFDKSMRDALIFNQTTGDYSILDPELTSRFENVTIAHRFGGAYRYNNPKINGNLNLFYEHTRLNGEQTYPYTASTARTYNYLVPRLNMRYTIGQGRNVNLSYRGGTRMPSASQLQDVVDNSNPTQLRGGNPDLMPSYTHNASVRIQLANTQKAQFSFIVVSADLTRDYIGNATFIALQGTEIRPGVFLGRGSRFTSPQNLGDSWSLRSFLNHTRPLTFIRSNVSINGGVSYTLQPTSDNDVITDARTVGLNAGTSVNSNISPNVDFSLNYRANYSIVENANNIGINSNFYTGRAFARLNLLPKGKFLFSTDLNFTHYSGLGEEFNNNILYWNASVGYKFLENNAAEIRLTVVDIMGQNNNVNRVIRDGYVEDVRNNVLTRFAMIHFSYNFRNFPGRS